jgi:hypothetical protein
MKILLRFVIVLALIIFPDLVLTISGRDSYLIVHSPVLIDVGILIYGISFVYLLVIVIRAISQKKWKQVAVVLAAVALLVAIYQYTVTTLTNKSIAEAREKVGNFFEKKNNVTVNIDDNAKEGYEQYLKKNRGIQSLILTLKVPHLRIYEFKVVPFDTSPFFVRLTVHQNSSDRIWIHN